jgi:hypothetical protein
VADVYVAGIPESRAMEIRIVLDATEPPTGHLELVDPDQGRSTDVTPFSGWLGLIYALEVAVGRRDPSREP